MMDASEAQNHDGPSAKSSVLGSLVRHADGALPLEDNNSGCSSNKTLPNEILLIIFKLVFRENRKRRDAQFEYHFSPSLLARQERALDSRISKFWKWQRQPSRSTVLFPISLAYVCRSWQRVLSMEPAFWTRVVVFIDEPFTSAQFLPEYFEWSHDEIIDVRITRRQYHNGQPHPDDPKEKSRVEHIMSHLQPHLHRCRSIRLDVKYRSSIVRATKYLTGDAPCLRILVLHSRLTDSVEDAEGVYDLVCPALECLHIDAKSFIDAARRGFPWTANNVGHLRRLTLGPYQPVDPQDGVLAADLFLHLQNNQWLISLCLQSVVFHPDLTFPGEPCISTNNLKIDNIAGDAVRALSLAMRSAVDVLTLSNCSLPEPVDFTFTFYLTLKSITGSGSLANILQGCRARTVTIVDCPSFDDGFLQTFGDGGPRGDCFGAWLMQELTVNGAKCRFSGAALQRALESRITAALRAHPREWWDEALEGHWSEVEFEAVSFLKELRVLDCDTSFTTSQEEWFKKNVKDWEWNKAEEHAAPSSQDGDAIESEEVEEDDSPDAIDVELDRLVSYESETESDKGASVINS